MQKEIRDEIKKVIEEHHKVGFPHERVLDRADKLVGCDHDLGYTFDYDGPSIFSASTKNPTWEFDEGFQEEDDHHGIVYWNFCPKCGQKLTPPNANGDSRVTP